MALPGVKVGPLDPDATSEFGQVSGKHSARALIRLHRQLKPPVLMKTLARPRDDARSKAVLDNLDEVHDYVSTLKLPNGDPVMPEGSRITGAAIRGDKGSGQMLTFTYEVPSGRSQKWHAPYNRDVLPISFDAGENYTRIKEMKDRGLVALDSEGTHTQILERHNAELRRERDALRNQVQSQAANDDAPAGESEDSRRPEALAAVNEDLGRENEELREKLALYENIVNAAGGGVPTGGLEEAAGSAGGESNDETIAAQDPPFEEYENMNAAALAEYLKNDARTPEERRAVLDFESTHANRKTVVSAAEQTLGAESGQ